MATILTVDDSASIRQMVNFTLKQAGYDVIEANDGQAGLDVALSKPIDLILSDVNMPVMDGITMVKELRKNSSFRFTPILMLTTESTSEMKAQGKAAGATGWLVKPFNPEQLISTVKRVLG